ncbi:hypothetical protein A2U01_0010453 [Trifolium medium]|uniref:Uncharacterized protein n=1 Tax=Trifolium medium TaxID=97028 RepID=A0A392MQK4_9FABA|nr:hypothetical protein [Trifolium medium]
MSSDKTGEKSIILREVSSESSPDNTEEKSIILREVSVESSEVQIVIPSDDDERLEEMLNNYANNDNCIVAVGEKMDEDLDEIVEEFPDYDDLPNHFFN